MGLHGLEDGASGARAGGLPRRPAAMLPVRAAGPMRKVNAATQQAGLTIPWA